MTETPSPEGEGVVSGGAGALPQTLPEALPLDSTRGNCPLTPFREGVGDNFMLCPRVYWGDARALPLTRQRVFDPLDSPFRD